jgi:hypothetical protein
VYALETVYTSKREMSPRYSNRREEGPGNAKKTT